MITQTPIRDTVGVTLCFDTALIFTDAGTLGVKDFKTGTIIEVGVASLGMLEALKNAADHLRIHAQ